MGFSLDVSVLYPWCIPPEKQVADSLLKLPGEEQLCHPCKRADGAVRVAATPMRYGADGDGACSPWCLAMLVSGPFTLWVSYRLRIKCCWHVSASPGARLLLEPSQCR